MAADTNSWIHEVDLEPSSSHLSMGTRNLGDRRWLVADDKADRELAERKRLLTEHGDLVLAEPTEAAPACDELEAVVRSTGVSVTDGPTPLSRLAVSVQEDFCLLESGDDGWILKSAILCFPSRWRLQEKLNKPLMGVHAPVVGYAERLGPRVDRLISGLGERIVLRRNWFIHPDAALYQPDRPVGGDPIVGSGDALTKMVVRSERQTLRLLPQSGWCAFTIRIQHCPLGELVSERSDDFLEWLTHADHDGRAHRGVSGEQARILVGALAS